MQSPRQNSAKVVAYARVSTDRQDVDSQKLALHEYAHARQYRINHFVEAEASAGKPASSRKMDELLSLLSSGDTLLVTELSRLGRNMIETLNLVKQIHDKGVKLEFVKQPELSLSGPQAPLLMAIYSHFAEVERSFISMRTRQGLELARARGKKPGRPRGSRNKKGSVLDPYRSRIINLVNAGVPIRSIARVINSESGKQFSYSTYRSFIQSEIKQIVSKKSSA